MSYRPAPIDIRDIVLSPDLVELTERLAENVHDIWATQRIAEGWSYAPVRNEAEKQRPDLVPYAELPDSEKDYDRNTAMQTLKAIIALGYEIRQQG